MASWTAGVLVECSEAAVVETEVASVAAGAWTAVALVVETRWPWGTPWTTDGTDGRDDEAG